MSALFHNHTDGGASIHKPVLLSELLDLLQPAPNENFVDGTTGGGGMAEEVLKRTAPNGKVLCIDIDKRALARAREKLSPKRGRTIFLNGNFKDIDLLVKSSGLERVDGIYLDLGISSDQLESETRGFSFRFPEAYLDMRMGENVPLRADVILNTFSRETLETILRSYGEESKAKVFAEEIIRFRKKRHFVKVSDLLSVVEKVYPARKSKLHPGTKVFQALRIAVNDELTNLETFLPKAFEVLSSKGRLAVIAFHSLEDRIVKRFVKEVIKSGHGTALSKKAIRPTREEVLKNPRSRSAKLRVVKKL